MLQHLLSLRYRNNTIDRSCRTCVILLLLLVCCTPYFLFASTAVFTPRVLVGGDLTPPTIPTPISATPVAFDQIDVVWGAATDNVAVAGYRVFRDSVQIATTTLTTFSDSSLLASTTYTYTVDAFDIFGNFSSSSDTVATTTLAVPPPPPPPVVSTPQNSPGTLIARIEKVEITTTPTTATLQWSANIQTRYILRWGRTSNYELGSIFGGQLALTHRTVVTGLEPSTQYYYEVESVTGLGARTITAQGTFITGGTVPTEVVPNVSRFSAMVAGSAVRLQWSNPVWSPFAYVRVIRSHLFYPQNPQDGSLIYEGTAENFFDAAALSERSPQYYTIFVYDSAGSISSGAVAVAARVVTTEDAQSLPAFPVIPLPIISEPPIDADQPVDLFAMNVALTQAGVTSYLHHPQQLSALSPIFISIPVGAVPPFLKTIIVSLTRPGQENEASTYLLKINPAGTQYEAMIPATREAGKSTLTVLLYNYELETLRTVSNSIYFGLPPRTIPFWWLFAAVVASLPFILLFAFFIDRRRAPSHKK